ncbi:MAG: pilus assembly protein PilM [Planctomycetes bacterium]|nr:pilus assembly protein PilM [Planctomycetota bacterium]
MNARLNRPGFLPIGIDVGSHWLKLAQLRRSPGGELALMAKASVELGSADHADPATRSRLVAEATRQALRNAPFKGRSYVLSLPASLTFVQHLKMGRLGADQMDKALQWELAGKLPYDPALAEVRHIVAGETHANNEVKQEVIAVAARRDVIVAHVDALSKLKLECQGVNVEPCAIVECFARLFRRAEDAERATLFIDIGASSTQAVVSHGPRMAFAKNIGLGGDQFDQAIGSALNLPIDEAHRQRLLRGGEGFDAAAAESIGRAITGPLSTLAQELTNCLRYYDSVFVNRPVERTVFLGGQAYDTALCQALAQRLSLPAQIGNPLKQIQIDSGLAVDGSCPEWAVCVGLCLGAAAGKGRAA